MLQTGYEWWKLLSTPLFGAEDDEDETTDSQEESDTDAEETEEDDGRVDPQVSNLRKESASYRVKAREERERAEKAEAELKKLRQAEMDELEKAQSDAGELTTQVATLQSDLEDARGALRAEQVHNAVILKATTMGFIDPQDALSMLDTTSLFTEEGAVDNKAVANQLNALKKNKPYLVGSGKGSFDGAPLDGKKPTLDPKSAEALSQKYSQQFKDQGMIPTPR